MKALNRLILLTVGFNFFIVIGAGHGIGFLGLIEIFWFTEMFNGDSKFSILGTYDNRLYTSSLIAMVGQIILIIAYFTKTAKKKFQIGLIGLFMLFFSFFVLTNDFIKSNTDSLSFWTGIPFLVSALILLITIFFMNKLKTE